jgi:hypothetical protein
MPLSLSSRLRGEAGQLYLVLLFLTHLKWTYRFPLIIEEYFISQTNTNTIFYTKLYFKFSLICIRSPIIEVRAKFTGH